LFDAGAHDCGTVASRDRSHRRSSPNKPLLLWLVPRLATTNFEAAERSPVAAVLAC